MSIEGKVASIRCGVARRFKIIRGAAAQTAPPDARAAPSWLGGTRPSMMPACRNIASPSGRSCDHEARYEHAQTDYRVGAWQIRDRARRVAFLASYGKAAVRKPLL